LEQVVMRTIELSYVEPNLLGTNTRRLAVPQSGRVMRLKEVGVLDRVGCGFLGRSFFLGGFLGCGAFGRSQTRQMGLHLRQAGPTDEVELNHLQRSFGGFAASVQCDQQTGDQSDVQLDGDAVFTVGDEMAAAEDAFEPTKEKFYRPAIAVGERNEVGVEVEAIGDEPKFFERTVGLAAADNDQTHEVFEDVFVVFGSLKAILSLTRATKDEPASRTSRKSW
jgi:hypothetical protein